MKELHLIVKCCCGCCSWWWLLPITTSPQALPSGSDWEQRHIPHQFLPAGKGEQDTTIFPHTCQLRDSPITYYFCFTSNIFSKWKSLAYRAFPLGCTSSSSNLTPGNKFICHFSKSSSSLLLISQERQTPCIISEILFFFLFLPAYQISGCFTKCL